MGDRLDRAERMVDTALENYTEALFQETRLRLRVLQRNHFPRHEVSLTDNHWRDISVCVRIGGQAARDLFCYGPHQDMSPGVRKAVELEDWFEEQASQWYTRIEDIRLEPRR